MSDPISPEAQKKLRPKPLPVTIETSDVEHTSNGTSGSWQEPAEPPTGRMVCMEISIDPQDLFEAAPTIEVGKSLSCTGRYTYGDIDQDVDFEFKVEAISMCKGTMDVQGKGASEDFQTGPTPLQSQKGCL